MRAPIIVSADDLRSQAWLCTMAAVGCDASRLPGWAVQLRNDATALLRKADAAEGRNPMHSGRSCGG